MTKLNSIKGEKEKVKYCPNCNRYELTEYGQCKGCSFYPANCYCDSLEEVKANTNSREEIIREADRIIGVYTIHATRNKLLEWVDKCVLPQIWEEKDKIIFLAEAMIEEAPIRCKTPDGCSGCSYAEGYVDSLNELIKRIESK